MNTQVQVSLKRLGLLSVLALLALSALGCGGGKKEEYTPPTDTRHAVGSAGVR